MRRSTLLVWLVGLVVCLFLGLIGGQPLLRRTLAVQLAGRSPLYAGQGHSPFLSGPLLPWRLSDETGRISEALGDGPQSEVAIFIENAIKTNVVPDNKAALSAEDFARAVSRHIDKIRRRFPDKKNTVWLCALRAQWGLLWMRHNRLAGELSDSHWQRHRAQGVASPEKTTAAANFTTRDVQDALQAIAQGARLEPENAYWDWVRAQYLLYLWRDPEAWHALETGARKTHFEAHEGQLLQGYVAACEKSLGRPLLPEEMNSVRQSAPDFSFPGRGAARILAWQAIKATRRGQHEQALKIYHGFCSIQWLRTQQTYRTLEAQAASNLIPLVLSRERALGNLLITDTNLAHGLGTDLQALENYAAQHGSASRQQQIKILAQRVRQVSAQQVAFNQVMASGRFYEGMRAAPWQLSLGAFGAATILLQQAVVAGLLWLLLGLALAWFLPQKKALNVPVERSDSVMGVLLLALIIGLMAFGALRESGRLVGGDLWPLFDLPAQWSVLDEAATILYSWGALVPVLFCTILAQGMTTWRATPSHPDTKKASHARNQNAKAQGETATQRARSERARGELALAPIVGRLALFLFSIAMLYWWQTALTAPVSEWVVPRRIAFVGLDVLGGGRTLRWAALHHLWPLTLALTGLLLGWTRWIFTAPPARRALILYRLRWLHQLLGAATLMAAAGYIIVSLYAVPARQAARHEVQDLLERGDNALWQQRLNEAKAQANPER